MKKLITILLTISIMFSFAIPVLAEEEIKVTVNNNQINFTEKPVLENDRILVPIRAIAEDLMFDVGWEPSTQKITLENFNTILTLYVGQDTITKELIYASSSYKDKNTVIKIDVPAKVIDSRTYIPLRAISELFGAEVDWNQSTSTANLTYALTKGDIVTFEDEGMEKFCRLAITLGDIDATNADNFEQIKLLDFETMPSKLYQGPIYKGALEKIKTLGINYFNIFAKTVHSIDDISKFPNLENIYLNSQYIQDLSSLTYKENWKEIDFINNPIFDFSPLTKIQVDHFINVGYSDYIFSYNNTTYNNSKNIPESERKKYELFSTNLVKIFNTMLNVIKDGITPNMTRSEKVKVINEWIINNIQYDNNKEFFNNIPTFYTNVNSEYYIDDSNLIECAILYHYAVCQGYSIIFDIFCDMLNIPNAIIYGIASNETHSWNIVQLENGDFYHIDTTWNCNDNIYFLVNDEYMEKDHTWNKDEVPQIINVKKDRTYFVNFN